MNMTRHLAACGFALLGAFANFAAGAQSNPVILPGGCGTGAGGAGSLAYLTVDSTLKLCTAASVSASITGFPTVQSTGTPIAVTTGGVTGTLPGGTVVVASNVGATNGAYCKLGASATTSDQLIPPNSWFSFTVGANTQLTCITSTSTTTVNMVGGSGLPTGSGGGGGGGGSSGAVFGPTAVGSAAANPPVLMAGTANATATGNVQVAKVDSSGTQFIDCSAVGNTLCGAINNPPNWRAQTQEQTAVANAANIPSAADATGKLINLPYANPENFLNGQITTAMTATTSTAVTGMGAQGAGVRVYVTACTISNNHATVGTMVNLQDGSGGAVLWQFPAAPAYGGATPVLPTPVKTTANTGLFAVNATTGSSTLVSCTGYKGV